MRREHTPLSPVCSSICRAGLQRIPIPRARFRRVALSIRNFRFLQPSLKSRSWPRRRLLTPPRLCLLRASHFARQNCLAPPTSSMPRCLPAMGSPRASWPSRRVAASHFAGLRPAGFSRSPGRAAELPRTLRSKADVFASRCSWFQSFCGQRSHGRILSRRKASFQLTQNARRRPSRTCIFSRILAGLA